MSDPDDFPATPDSDNLAEADVPADAYGEYEELGSGRAPSWLKRAAVVFLVLAIVGVGVAGAGALWIRGHLDPSGEPGEEVAVEIPLGSSTSRIAELLEQNGVITSARVFRYYVRFKDEGPFQAGSYSFRERSSMADVIDALNGGPIIVFSDVTVPEGLTLEEIYPRIGPPGGIERFSVDAFRAAVEDPGLRSKFQPDDVELMEGLLFPDTYRVDERETEADLARRMVTALDEIATALGYEAAPERFGLTPYEVLIIASLIEEEAKVDEDRPKMARVIYNRLERGWPLGIDATVIYATGDQQITRSDLDSDSPYNTRKFTGLPPTPIAAPGRASLEAAINPEDGPWMYYVLTDPDGLRHSFSTTDAEFQRDKRTCQQLGHCG